VLNKHCLYPFTNEQPCKKAAKYCLVLSEGNHSQFTLRGLRGQRLIAYPRPGHPLAWLKSFIEYLTLRLGGSEAYDKKFRRGIIAFHEAKI
jgi:hypothetical protein